MNNYKSISKLLITFAISILSIQASAYDTNLDKMINVSEFMRSKGIPEGTGDADELRSIKSTGFNKAVIANWYSKEENRPVFTLDLYSKTYLQTTNEYTGATPDGLYKTCIEQRKNHPAQNGEFNYTQFNSWQIGPDIIYGMDCSVEKRINLTKKISDVLVKNEIKPSIMAWPTKLFNNVFVVDSAGGNYLTYLGNETAYKVPFFTTHTIHSIQKILHTIPQNILITKHT